MITTMKRDELIEQVKNLGFTNVAKELQENPGQPQQHYSQMVMNYRSHEDKKWVAMEFIALIVNTDEN